MKPSFGRLVPSPEKTAQNMLYPFSLLCAPTPKKVEVEYVLPYGLVGHYNQGNTNACTGYSASWMSSINNYLNEGEIKYDARWLYHRGQEIDGDPITDPQNDVGGYIWAVMDVLRKQGHLRSGYSEPMPNDGIENYLWIKSIDDLRSAFELGRSVVFGVRWYENFMQPSTRAGEYWIAFGNRWGRVLGGHAICAYACSDQRQGVKLVNSWGPTYPEVWISYKSLDRLLSEDGECCVAIDRKPTTPVPNAPTSQYMDVTIKTSDGQTFSGRLVK